MRTETGRHSNPTPLKSIRQKCLDCRGQEQAAVRQCDHAACPLHTLRMGRGSRSTLKPIRAFCLWCVNDQRQEIRLCPSLSCPLWPYRMGRRPQIPRTMSEIALTGGCSHTKNDPDGLTIEDRISISRMEA